MPFLDGTPDLRGTIFSDHDLHLARTYLLQMLPIHVPGWLEDPQGIIGRWWNNDGISPACELIWLTQMIALLETRVTEDSKPIFFEKVTSLFRFPFSPSKRHTFLPQQFQEKVAELEIAFHLSERVSPISFEPRILGTQAHHGTTPKNIDFGIRFPEQDVVVEVTVLRNKLLDDWDIAIRQVVTMIQAEVRRRKISRQVQLVFPLDFRLSSVTPTSIKLLGEALQAHETGNTTLLLGNKTGSVQWKGLPHFVLSEDDMLHPTQRLVPEGAATFSSEPLPIISYSFSWDFTYDGDDEVLFRSIRNTLDQKRKQFKHNMAYVLALKIGHSRIDSDYVRAVINNRIWPNQDYAWITGIAIYTPQPDFRASSPPRSLMISLNPNAKRVSISLIALFGYGMDFHR